jgi:hypothetical protein
MYMGKYRMKKIRKYHSFPVFIKRKIRYPVPKRRVRAINMKIRMDIFFRYSLPFVECLGKEVSYQCSRSA